MSIWTMPKASNDLGQREEEFIPLFYLCCKATICPLANSKEYINGVIATMRCCDKAGLLMAELCRVPELEFVTFRDSKVRVTYHKGVPEEMVREKVLQTIRRYPRD